jgi:hypothetical protein
MFGYRIEARLAGQIRERWEAQKTWPNPVASPSEPDNASPDRKDVERDVGETPKPDANTIAGTQLGGSE